MTGRVARLGSLYLDWSPRTSRRSRGPGRPCSAHAPSGRRRRASTRRWPRPARGRRRSAWSRRVGDDDAGRWCADRLGAGRDRDPAPGRRARADRARSSSRLATTARRRHRSSSRAPTTAPRLRHRPRRHGARRRLLVQLEVPPAVVAADPARGRPPADARVVVNTARTPPSTPDGGRPGRPGRRGRAGRRAAGRRRPRSRARSCHVRARRRGVGRRCGSTATTSAPRPWRPAGPRPSAARSPQPWPPEPTGRAALRAAVAAAGEPAVRGS